MLFTIVIIIVTSFTGCGNESKIQRALDKSPPDYEAVEKLINNGENLTDVIFQNKAYWLKLASQKKWGLIVTAFAENGTEIGKNKSEFIELINTFLNFNQYNSLTMILSASCKVKCRVQRNACLS